MGVWGLGVWVRVRGFGGLGFRGLRVSEIVSTHSNNASNDFGGLLGITTGVEFTGAAAAPAAGANAGEALAASNSLGTPRWHNMEVFGNHFG